MTMNSKSQIYEKGLELAEAGQHEQALKCIKEHLKVNPGDGQAWNDAGAIIYCLGEVDEAIENFEKARECAVTLRRYCGICVKHISMADIRTWRCSFSIRWSEWRYLILML